MKPAFLSISSSLVRPLCLAYSLLSFQIFGAPSNAPFEFRDGDRVVLLGDTLIEREQSYAYLEQRLTIQFPERHVIFRNLGWSADTPAGESRAGFDFNEPHKVFEKLTAHLNAARPTVVIVGYGMADSFAGEAGLPSFKTKMKRLLDVISAQGTNPPVRVVLLSPIRHEKLPPPLPDPAPHNRQLSAYVTALRQIAEERRCAFIDLAELTEAVEKEVAAAPLTDNGIHLSAYGYLRAAERVEAGLGWAQNRWDATIEWGKQSHQTKGTTAAEVTPVDDGIRFALTHERVVNPFVRHQQKVLPAATPPGRLQINGLKPGKYLLKVDGKELLEASHTDWRRGIPIDQGPQFEQAEELRQAILKKNELYFNRWRPQNETYLFGFRKHEQGQNAKEIPMFDPLISEQEAKIATLRKPRKHVFEVLPVKAQNAGLGAEKPSTPPRTEQASPGRNKEAARMFEVADGFEVNLFAESPMLAKPIQINFDPQGRLWIASSSVYPQIQPGQPADDKVVVLEDKDRDGYAEKSTVFADGLLIPTGVAPGDGGVYVGQSTELLHFKDNDGDGKADQRRVVLSGFGTEDTHHIVHTLRWGQDGQLYFNQSIYIHSHIETPHGVRRLNSGGIWHLRPPTLELGVYLKGFCNPWGHEFDHFGQSFVTDGAGFQGLSFSIPGATYFTYANMRRELKSISPGNYPKFCGLEIVRSRHFPEDWQGNAVTCDFRAHRIVRFGIEEQGSGYVTRALPDLLRTTNVAFRPIDVKLGPDGALYIADWSNPIIQHGEVDFRDPRRDHEQGRIWRVSTKGRPLVKSPNFSSLNNPQLLDFTASPNAYEQQQARRVLHERGHAIRKDLARWTQSQQGSFALLEALWLYQGIDNVEPELLQKVLRSNDGRVRAAAVRVLSFWHSRVRDPVGLLAERIVDEHPRARLEAMRALAQIPGARSAELVLSALERPMDPFLDYGLWLSINDLAPSWVAAVKSGEWKIAGREKQLEFALGAIQPELAAEVLGLVLPDKKFPRDGAGRWIELVGSAGNQPQLNRLFAQTIEGGFDGGATGRALQALNEAARKRSMKPSGSLAGLTSLFQNSNSDVQEQAIRLAGSWKLKQSVPTLLKLISAESTPDRVRGAGFDALREIGGSDVMAGVLPLTTKAQPAATRRQAILCLAALDLDQVTPKAVELLAETSNENDALDFWRSLLGIKGAGSKLAPALPKTDLPPVMAKAGLRAAREGGRNEPELVWALTRGANLEEQTLTAAELQQLATRVTSDGNPARGENVFRRKELACFTCHAIGGVGGKVGPDLTSIGTSAQPDYLIESMLYPNRKIKEGYHSVIVETKDSMEFSGVLVRENSDELVLRDATDREMTIAKKDVQNRTTGNSLMPSGLLDLLNPQERLDLFRFLSELGKPGAYDASKGNVARSWKLLVETHELAQFGEERVLATAFDDPKWTPARTLVDGRLLRSELVAALEPFERRSPQAVYLAARFEVASAGPVSFQAAGADGALAWIDGKRAGTCSDLKLPLEPGTHTILVRVETKKLPDSIRLHSPEAVFIGNWK